LPEFVTSRRSDVLADTKVLEVSYKANLLRVIESEFEALGLGSFLLGTSTLDQLVHIDVQLPGVSLAGNPVAIELLDSYRTAVNTGQPLGRWLVRRRILEAYGFHVVTLSLEAFLASKDRRAMMASLLQGCSRNSNGQS
jgi:hypothetical protein